MGILDVSIERFKIVETEIETLLDIYTCLLDLEENMILLKP